MSKDKILKLILDYPTRTFALREIARLCSINPNTVSNNIGKMEQEGLITVKKTYLSLQISAARNSISFIAAKRAYIIETLIKYNLPTLFFPTNQTAAEDLTIVLIDEHAKGIDIESDPLRIIAIGAKIPSSLSKKVKTFEKDLNRKIEFISDSGKSSSKYYKQIINGIVINGEL